MDPQTFLGSEDYLYYILHFHTDIIVAYVGHILTNELMDSKQYVSIFSSLFPLQYPFHSDIARHTSHNYLFEVAGADSPDVNMPVFDAAYLGNATRFLNHGTDGKANVDAKSMSLNISHDEMVDINEKKLCWSLESIKLDFTQVSATDFVLCECLVIVS